MKKSEKLIAICIIFLVLGLSLYKNSSFYINSNMYLSSKDESDKSIYHMTNVIDSQDGKSFDFDKFTGKWSLMEAFCDKDTKIVIKDKTKINKGLFYIVVLDSNYNIVAKKNEVKENEDEDIEINIPKSDKYFIRIIGEDAGGHLNIKVKGNDNINHIDFFSA